MPQKTNVKEINQQHLKETNNDKDNEINNVCKLNVHPLNGADS